jgi:type II secretory pathway component GspD/PulD (secretin)
LVALLLAGAALLAPSTASAQSSDAPPRPARARDQMRAAQECYRTGDYEGAALFYKDADANKQQLTQREQADLADLIKANNTALDARRTGAERLRMAEEAISKGRLNEAAAFVRAESANQYLKPADKALLAQLTDQLHAKNVAGIPGPSKTPGAADPSKENYGTLVQMARSAYLRGDYDAAEAYCKLADKKAGVLPDWATPWKTDSSTRVMRDVQAARLKLAAVHEQQATAGQEVKQDQPSMLTSGLNKVKSLFSPAASSVKTDNDGTRFDTEKNVVAGPAATSGPQQPQQVVSKDAIEARMYRDKAIEELKKPDGDLLTAKKYAELAKAKMDPNAWWESPNPDELLRDITAHLAQGGNGDSKGQRASNSAAVVDASSARARLKDARALYAQNKLDESDRLCAQVAAVKMTWGLFDGDSPDKLRNDIIAARQKADKAESVKLLAEARKALANGDCEEARAKAWKAKQLHGPYNVWELGDRPEKLLADVDVALKAKKQSPANDTSVASNNRSPSGGGPASPKSSAGDGPPAPMSMAAMADRQRAQILLEEARNLQKQGKLTEAYAKACEARVAAVSANKAGGSFAPGEETPDLFLYALASQAKSRVEGLCRVADENTSGDANDPVRLKKAAESLAEAKQLTVQFGLDVGPVDAKLAWVAQRQSSPGTVYQAFAPQPTGDSMGCKLLDDARAEIKAGRIEQARKFAEEALEPKYAVQKQAEDVLHDIQIEMVYRMRLDADRAFANAHDAYARGDYRLARSILAGLDEALLSDQNKARLREIAMQPQMQTDSPSNPIKVVGGPIDVKGPGIANATDLPPAPEDKTANSEFSVINGLNRVELDKLRKESTAALRIANQRAEAGDFDGAIEALRTYKVSLAASSLEPEQIDTLQRPVDRFVQQYQERKARKVFEKEIIAQERSGHDRERERTVQEQETQAKIVKWADEAKQLMHDGKFDEALVLWYKVKDLDSENVVAQAGIFETRIQIEEKKNNVSDRHWQEQFLEGNRSDAGPVLNMQKPSVVDPSSWQWAKNRKSQTYVKSELKDPEEKRIERALWERKMTLNFNSVPLYTCIQAIREYLGNVNIVTDDQAIQAAGIHMDQPATLNVTDMQLKSVLNVLLKNAGLTYVIQNQSITITTQDYAKGNLKRIVYSVADLTIPIKNEPSLQGELYKAHWQKQINDQLKGSGLTYGAPTPYGVPGGLPPGQTVGGMNGNYGTDQANTLAGRPNKPEELQNLLIRLITSTVAPESWSEVGGQGTIQYYPLGLALVVNQTQDIQEQIIDLLTALRRLQDLEVAIEMKLVSVSEAFYEFMGVNFNMNIPTGTVTQGNNVEQLVTGNFAPNSLINSFRPNGTFVSGLTPAGTFTPNLGVPISTSSFGFALPPFGGYPGTLGADGGLSLGLAFLSDIQVSMFMEAAQGDRRTNVMQAPKITVFNGQTANITVGDELFFLTEIDVIQVNGQMVFQPTQQAFPYGVAMTVTPVVSADRRFVRLNLNPTLQNLVSSTVPLLPVQQIVPQLLFDNISPPQQQVFTMFFQQPSNSFISLNTTVMVPDGGTVLMGGLKTLVEGRNESGPPVLSKIPYINRLFTNVGYGRETQSLMIMVTARIIINEEEELEFTGALPRIPR